MQQYLKLLNHVMKHGVDKPDRTATGIRSVFGYQMRFDLSQGFPLVTTKKCHVRSIIHELLWFLRGDTNVAYLHANKVSIWDEWADEKGDLGPIYGKQWRAWPTAEGGSIDQIARLIHDIKHDPHSRRLILNAWNVGDLAKMALPPCHLLAQFSVVQQRLSCLLTQRSADLFLGVPFNIASYALLTHMLAQQTGLDVGEFIWSGGDCHIYHNHFEQVQEQLARKPYPLPQLVIKRCPPSINDYAYEDFVLENYQSHPAIKAAVAV